MATYSSILAWKIPWTEEPGRLQSMGLQIDTTEPLHIISSHHTYCYHSGATHRHPPLGTCKSVIIYLFLFCLSEVFVVIVQMEDTVILMKKARSCHSHSKPPKTSRPASSALTVPGSSANHISCLSHSGFLQIFKQARHSPCPTPFSDMLTPHLLQIWSHAMSSKSLIVNGRPDYKLTQHSLPASITPNIPLLITFMSVPLCSQCESHKGKGSGILFLGVLATENSAWQRKGFQFVFVEWKKEERSRDYKRWDSKEKSD